jgi:flavin-dependent dehydrogenase
MTSEDSWDILIVGGGLAGLTAALHLSKAGVKVLLIEKQTYPQHKVCGEYVSNEVLPYVRSLGIDPMAVGAKQITQFEMSTKKGALLQAKLPLGGFGISRYAFDHALYIAASKQADFAFETVRSIAFSGDRFTVTTQSDRSYQAPFAIGAYGKRSTLDKTLVRSFIQQKSPWLGVKAHYQADFPEDTVALHNFNGGYCGLSKTETGAVNACYLTTYESFKRTENIVAFQQEVLSQNPNLKAFFQEAVPLFEKPLTISQISFQKKEPIVDHVFMLGDSAGLIHPLCGNGMAMAIHAAKLFSELYLEAKQAGVIDRAQLENDYKKAWKSTFENRLKSGRRIQSALLHPVAATVGLGLVKTIPSILPSIIKRTHGTLV